MAAASSRVRLDLNNLGFREVFLRLELAELKQVVGSLRRLRDMEWGSVYRHPGFEWEGVRHIRTPSGAPAYSLRLSQKIRALCYRDGDFLRLLSLHPDHDSAYEK